MELHLGHRVIHDMSMNHYNNVYFIEDFAITMITNDFCCVNSSIGFFVLANVVLATTIMVLGGLEPEILVITVSGVGHFGKWPPLGQKLQWPYIQKSSLGHVLTVCQMLCLYHKRHNSLTIKIFQLLLKGFNSG